MEEPVAKLHDLGKSKILSPIGEERNSLSERADGGLPERVGEEARPQPDSKGRFYVSKSFVTGSEHKLHTLASFPIDVIWHENKTTYLSVKKMGGRLFLRLHRLFYDAPTPVLEALLRYCLRRSAKDRAVIKQMAHLYFSRHIREPKPLKSLGAVYDLQEILDRLLAVYSLEKISIGWSDRNGCKRFRSITFGTYDQHTCQIRINPILDDPDVPLYFLEFIIYHEMLHALCSSKMDSRGRCSVHTREFREKERLFPHYEQAKKWEKGCLTFFRKRKLHGRP